MPSLEKSVLDPNEFVNQWVEYWNSRDTSAVHQLYDDNFEFYSPFLEDKGEEYPDGKITNKETLKSYFDKIVKNIPDLQLKLKDVESEQNKVNFTYYSTSEGLTAEASIIFNEQGKIKKSVFNFLKESLFADRVNRIPRSFIREILKVTAQPDIISFAGGLPHPDFFPVEELEEATAKVLKNNGRSVLQYTTSEGFKPLREFIAKRYATHKGHEISPDQILITNGSQQSLDLAGKVFINESDKVLLERPSYLGAIQAFSSYEPQFINVELEEDGINLEELEETLKNHRIKLFYTVPNFQNPTGISYSLEKREKTAQLFSRTKTWVMEDDPYGEIRFLGKNLPPIGKYLPQQSIMAGSFSKIVAPGLRLGWIVAPANVLEKIITLKQATDLHSNYLSQRIIYQFIQDNDLDQHIERIREAYRLQRNAMVEMIEKHFPAEVQYTKPEGGMFLWVTLPQQHQSIELFKEAIEAKVAFVPGNPFYTDGQGNNTFRLNFSNSSIDKIEKGIERLGKILHQYLARK